MTQFNYTSGNINNLDAGDSLNMLDIKGPLQDLQTFLNSRTFNEDNLPVSLLQRLGLNDSSGQKGRGKSIIATEQSTSATTYAVGNLATPDRVSGIVLPTDGLIIIALSVMIKNTVANAKAALFLGANQLVVGQAGVPPFGLEATIDQGKYGWLNTAPAALSYSAVTGSDSTGGTTTGQVVGNLSAAYAGGLMAVFAAAGTYDVSLQVKNTAGGTVFLKERKLWVWSIGF